jgi:hypothetical protein
LSALAVLTATREISTLISSISGPGAVVYFAQRRPSDRVAGACMSHVMLSYSRDNRDFVDRLASALKQGGVDVWYDPMLSLDETSFRHEIKNKILNSRAVLVVWSKGACDSEWVAAEAGEANKHKKLLQAVSEECDLPLPFGNKNYVDLSRWDRVSVSAEIDKIIQAVGQFPSPVQTAPAPAPPVDVEDLTEVRRVLDDDARVKVLKFLAKGEISKVYLGRYGSRPVAVKAIRDVDLVYLPAAEQEALANEMDLASSLQNPCFLRVSHILFQKERCFIVSDFCDGGTIEQKLSQGARFSIPDVVEIISQLSKAVTEAHSRGLKHLRVVVQRMHGHRPRRPSGDPGDRSQGQPVRAWHAGVDDARGRDAVCDRGPPVCAQED